MQLAGARLGRVLAMFGTLTSNMNTPAYQALDREWSPKLAAAQDEITFDPALFARIEAIHAAPAGLNAQQKRLVDRLAGPAAADHTRILASPLNTSRPCHFRCA